MYPLDRLDPSERRALLNELKLEEAKQREQDQIDDYNKVKAELIEWNSWLEKPEWKWENRTDYVVAHNGSLTICKNVNYGYNVSIHYIDPLILTSDNGNQPRQVSSWHGGPEELIKEMIKKLKEFTAKLEEAIKVPDDE